MMRAMLRVEHPVVIEAWRYYVNEVSRHMPRAS